MRGSWWVAGLAAGLLAVAGCSDDPDGAGGSGPASQEETCAAAEQAMKELGAELQIALTAWDGTPENAGEITTAAQGGSQELRELAARAADGELRVLLDDLAGQVDEFGASWASGGAEPDLAAVEAALQPLEDRCGFGPGGG